MLGTVLQAGLQFARDDIAGTAGNGAVRGALQVNAALEARHAEEVARLQCAVEAEKKEREVAMARLRKEQEAERERVKRAIAELKKKLDRQVPEEQDYETCPSLYLGVSI
jgi:hypothetical protein